MDGRHRRWLPPRHRHERAAAPHKQHLHLLPIRFAAAPVSVHAVPALFALPPSAASSPPGSRPAPAGDGDDHGQARRAAASGGGCLYGKARGAEEDGARRRVQEEEAAGAEAGGGAAEGAAEEAAGARHAAAAGAGGRRGAGRSGARGDQGVRRGPDARPRAAAKQPAPAHLLARPGCRRQVCHGILRRVDTGQRAAAITGGGGRPPAPQVRPRLSFTKTFSLDERKVQPWLF